MISGAVQETTRLTRAQVMPLTTSWIAGAGTLLRVQDPMEGGVIYIYTITLVPRQGRPSTWNLVRRGPRYAHARARTTPSTSPWQPTFGGCTARTKPM